MFLPLELGWVLPLTAPEWSQMQLVPNIVYRLDAVLQVGLVCVLFLGGVQVGEAACLAVSGLVCWGSAQGGDKTV